MNSSRRQRTDSLDRQLQLASSNTNIPVPPGFHFDNDPELMEIWHSFTSARTPDDWRQHDLFCVAKIVQLERDIRAQKELLDQEGPIAVSAKGNPIENVRLRIVSSLIMQQLALIRSIKINEVPTDARTLAKNAKVMKDLKADIENDDDLLA